MLWKCSIGIPSPPLALFVVMLSKAHLTSHSRCLALGEWSYYCGYLGCEGLFCIVLLCILVTSSYYVLILLGPYHFCPLLCHVCMKCSLGISNFLEEISSLSHSIVFLYFFALITEEGFHISPCYSLELCKEVEENYRMGKTRNLFKKIRDTKGTFHAKMDKKRTEMVWT